jgi:hypothetical protein
MWGYAPNATRDRDRGGPLDVLGRQLAFPNHSAQTSGWLKTLPLGPDDTEKLLNGNARRLLKF